MEQCFPYLREQIRLIRPKVLCALGRIAAQALLKTTTPLGKLRGRWHEYEGVPLLMTYHPAALLRFPQYKRDTWEDIKKLKARYDELREQA
jgi:DNA polymerase